MCKPVLWLLPWLLFCCSDPAEQTADGGLLDNGVGDGQIAETSSLDFSKSDGFGADGNSRDDQLVSDSSPPKACIASQALLARIDPSRMLTDLQALTKSERTTASGQAKAAAYLQQQLAPLGLQVRSLDYVYKGATYSNIEATLGGIASDRYVFIGSHFDAVSQYPGADDNGSGTVAVLEIARALAGCKLNRTVRFLFFSNEEVGTIGSTQYVQGIKGSVPAQAILGYLNLDMIAYARPGEDLDLATRPAHAALVNDMAASMSKWSTLPIKKVIDDQCG